MSDQTLARRLGRPILATALIALSLGVAGCSSVPDALTSAVDEGISATASGELAVKQADAGRALPGLTDTVLSDALTELQKAETSVAELKPSESESSDRADVLAAIQSSMDAVLAAREAVASGGDLASSADDLSAALDDLTTLSKGLE